jgi:hypothetical protein
MCQVRIVRPAFRQVIVHILKEFSRSHSARELILKFRSRKGTAFLRHIEPESGANAAMAPLRANRRFRVLRSFELFEY